ncbi:MAG: polysaccharide pyruvyl transferase family protein [Candidatus Omnitrophota bacterium]
MKTVLFSGYYGQRNTGDDAFCVVAAWGAKKYWHAEKIAFLSSTVPELTVPANCVLPVKQCFKGQRLLWSILSSIQAKNIVYLGGSLFHQRPKSLASQFFYGRSIGSKNKKVSAVGVSLGPFHGKEDRAYIRSVLNNMVFLSVRDEASYQIAQEMRLDVPTVKSFDPAVLLPLVYGEGFLSSENQRKDRPVLGISLCHFERFVCRDVSTEQRREKIILEALKELVKNHEVALKFFIFNDHPDLGDAELTNRIVGALEGYPFVDIVPYSLNPGQTLKAAKGCDAFLGVRLHAAIFAYTVGIPFALVEYHRKCSDFLDEIGYKEEFRIPSDGGSVKNMVRILECLLAKERVISLFNMKLAEAQELSLLNFAEAPGLRE